jgi:enamine deaminase RidA (YjgF/YER057c/UK114 family)
MTPIKRTGFYDLLHEVVEYNGVLYFSGVIAEDLSLDMAGQAKDAFNQIDKLLAQHGSSRERLLTALIFVTDMKQKPAMNKVWKEWLPPQAMPTRATIGVSDLEPNILIEIVVTAAKA